jgi:AcrR family transcriptional regulator
MTAESEPVRDREDDADQAAKTGARVRQGESTRQRLLEAARDLFADRGYQSTAIEDVLRSAGVSRGALYHHFSTKRELFEGVLELVESGMARTIADAAAGAGSSHEALVAGSAAFLDLVDDLAIRQIALIDAPTALGWERWREIEEHYGLGQIRAALARDASEGRLDPPLVEYLAHVILAALIELGLMVARADDRVQARQRAQATFELLVAELVPSA